MDSQDARLREIIQRSMKDQMPPDDVRQKLLDALRRRLFRGKRLDLLREGSEYSRSNPPLVVPASELSH